MRGCDCSFRRLDYSFLHPCHSRDYGDYVLREADCIFDREDKISGQLEAIPRLCDNSYRFPRYRLRHKYNSLRLVYYSLKCFCWSLRLSDSSRILSTGVSAASNGAGMALTGVPPALNAVDASQTMVDVAVTAVRIA
jgi:hypothetical protein